jgi:hypothetical protein
MTSDFLLHAWPVHPKRIDNFTNIVRPFCLKIGQIAGYPLPSCQGAGIIFSVLTPISISTTTSISNGNLQPLVSFVVEVVVEIAVVVAVTVETDSLSNPS